MSLWRVDDLPHAVVTHPLDDIIEHTMTAQCPCGPQVEAHGYTCGGHHALALAVRLIINHQAMDGR